MLHVVCCLHTLHDVCVQARGKMTWLVLIAAVAFASGAGFTRTANAVRPRARTLVCVGSVRKSGWHDGSGHIGV
jgi:hypothetical protein